MAQTTNANVIVKLHHGDEIRRFTSSIAALTWSAISTRATDAFELSSRFKMTYVDDENDRVTLSTNEELAEAISLALKNEPAVLRLTIHLSDDKKRSDPPKKEGQNATVRDAANNTAANAEPDIASFIENVAKQLPALVGQLPPALRQMLPRAELDLAATIDANNNNSANAARDPYVQAHPTNAQEGVHVGVTCDKSGMCPIVGDRYHLVGHNYDLCSNEYKKLDDKEKELFMRIPAPDSKQAGAAKLGIHPGVECDRSGVNPIVGTRYNLRGHDYDLCQDEFDKLPATEKLLYDAIPPRVMPTGCGPCPGMAAAAAAAAAAAGNGNAGNFGNGNCHTGPWQKGPWWRCRPGGPMNAGGPCGGPGPKFAARFVRDVSIFDGTQMAGGTQFTKIWRLKNVGEVPWPAGTRIMFVGGDQMSTELSVPLARDTPVMPGEEVDVAVEMKAPEEPGRYLGYWRLTGPHMRRRFGQRIWCHVQVVDPQAPPELADDLQNMHATMLEIQKKKSDLAKANEPDVADAEDEPESAPAASVPAASVPAEDLPTPPPPQPVTPAKGDAVADKDKEDVLNAVLNVLNAVDAPLEAAAEPMAAEEPMETSKDGAASDDGVLVGEEGHEAAAAPSVPGPSGTSVAATLEAMGFMDKAMIETVIGKHGDDVEACARDLVAASEWDSLLDDLAEMGFNNRELNKTLMLKNSGNIKRTVKDLVEA